MDTVTISPKFQVVIPLSVRRLLGLKPGQKVQVFPYAGRIELVPILPMRKLRGALPDIDTMVERDTDRV